MFKQLFCILLAAACVSLMLAASVSAQKNMVTIPYRKCSDSQNMSTRMQAPRDECVQLKTINPDFCGTKPVRRYGGAKYEACTAYKDSSCTQPGENDGNAYHICKRGI